MGSLIKERGKTAAQEERTCGRVIQGAPPDLLPLTSPWATLRNRIAGEGEEKNLQPDLKARVWTETRNYVVTLSLTLRPWSAPRPPPLNQQVGKLRPGETRAAGHLTLHKAW